MSNETTGAGSNKNLARREWPHWVVLSGLFAASVVVWDRVPERVPMHWNFRGEVDGYGGRLEGLLLLPAIALGLYVMLLVLPRLDPGRANYASFAGPYTVIRFALLALMLGIHALVIATALGYAVNAGRWIPVGVGALFIVLGNVMGKVRPNYFVGIRTPWTLASARSWEKTHRAGGRLFVVAGIALAIAALIGRPEALVAVGVFGAASIAWLFYYSFTVWRDDTAPVPVTGTKPGVEEH